MNTPAVVRSVVPKMIVLIILAISLAVANGISIESRPMRVEEDNDSLLGSRIPLDLFV